VQNQLTVIQDLVCHEMVECVLIHGATQKFGEFDYKKNFLTITLSFHRLLRSSPLGHVYSDPSVFPMISCIPGSSQM